ncbi:MAG: hypothetical protein L3J43_04890 [Sulfurovum sp.]|nr:hypothetical protein [Sulfurovum sp.]
MEQERKNNDDMLSDNEEELLEESQGQNKYKILFLGLGVLFFFILVVVMFFFLRELNPPVEIKKTSRVEVEPKKFSEDFLPPKKDFPLLPKQAEVTKVEKIPPKIYKSKIIKGGGGKLDIHQDKTSTPTQEQEKPKSIKKVNIEPKAKVKKQEAYRGGSSTVAGIHQYNQNLSLARGTLIPCSLNVRLISMVSGQLTCTVAEDIYSVNGNVLLLEKGSTAVGSYKSASLQNGMNRMYAIWDDIRTPNNVIVSVGSGTSDELGSAGMVGEVDNHWMMRFGGAILLSIIDDAFSTLANKHGNDVGGVVIGGTMNRGRSMGNTVLKQYINIPPTLYKNHGDLINIFVNKDIDFSEVYKLKRR